ncbi:ataxin-7-like protein 3 [Holotrichia oblita]|uniref:Ataxin-7-like protein 3 n=1 Tax=Holotrichia oblita TaxID=644536 RepID=A0ACB9TR62_HOLOL|nr:ataxin-7-like protein 3 [Holotrichia oblita]
MEDESVQTYTFDKEFHEIVNNKEILKRTTEKFLNNLIDDLTLGIIFDAHRKFKTKAFNLDRDTSPAEAEETPSNIDIFGQHNMKKTQECVCPNCDRAVAASRFAPHLESCMGMGRFRSRNVRRVVNNNKDRDNSSYTGIASDDEDDADWNSGDKRSRKKKERNGAKKGKVCNGLGTPKKNSENDCMDTVDIEGDEDGDLASLRDILQDHSNGSSPVDSTTSSNSSTTKKREKNKNKKNHKRDRTSPNVNSNVD